MDTAPVWFTTFDPQTEAPLPPVLDRSAVTPDPAWVQGHVGRVPFALVAAGQAADQVPLRWEGRGYSGAALRVQGRVAALIGMGSGTLPALFHALTLTRRPALPAVDDLQDALAFGLWALDGATVTRLASLLPPGWYVASLVTTRPSVVVPGGPLDYMTHERERYWPGDLQEGSWPGVDVPTAPPALSYRAPGWQEPGMITYTDGRQVPGEEAGVSVLLPTQAEKSLDARRVAFYREQFRAGARPTAVCVQVIEERDSNSQVEGTLLSNLTLAVNVIVDGHHKVRAAALEGAALTVLTFTALPYTATPRVLKPWIERTQRHLARFDALSSLPE
ncbi:hypothetical protein [Deinococcus sedimenti]|uniref:Uncharacterized protein n=1 Tax=Deinococcus sedimenti TaxID=1867090 RepID=A0ABQ2RZB8_9DEIO|nr:hypothetical protein [Deinococcus sedimenti]GGR81985.1 hypothetical protein GCM10008960_06220 [Deinococcus sedimenti]